MQNSAVKKILEVSIVSRNTGGVEKFLHDVFMHLDTDCFDIDFLSPGGGSYDLYRKDIEERGGRLLDLGVNREPLAGKLIYGCKLFAFLSTNEYDVVHVNSGAFLFCFQVAFIAKLCKQKRIIIHSHSISQYGIAKATIVYLLKPVLERLADDLLACSKEAAARVFSKKSIEKGRVRIVPNGIETGKFKFSEENRKKYRNEFDVDDKTVYVHVGRFVYEKNHDFLIDVFNEIQKIQDDAILFLVGDGPNKDKITKKVEQLNISDKVIFLGLRDDVNELLSAMDVFILPSISEGLPIAAIEAQTNGLCTICSDGVPWEASISGLYKSISLDKSPKEWAEEIIKHIERRHSKRSDYYINTVEKGFDIINTSKIITGIYLEKDTIHCNSCEKLVKQKQKNHR